MKFPKLITIKKTGKIFFVFIVSLCFLGFFIERIKNNSPFFSSFYQRNKLPVYDLQLSDFLTDSLEIVDSQTFISTDANFPPAFIFKNEMGVNPPIKIRSILIDADFSVDQASISVDAMIPGNKWYRPTYTPVLNMSKPYKNIEKNDFYDLLRWVTVSNQTKMPLVIPCSFNNTAYLRIKFFVESDVTVKINKIVINPRLGFFYNFKLMEYISICFFLILIFYFIYFLPYKEKNMIHENINEHIAYSKKPENIFCIFAFVFGMIFVFLVPPFQSIDESIHFTKCYSLSTLHLFPEESKDGKTIGLRLPDELRIMEYQFEGNIGFIGKKYDYLQYLNVKNLKLGGNEHIRNVGGTQTIIPLVYLPQAIGIFIVRLAENLFFQFDASVLDLFYAGRIFNLIFYLVIGYLSIKTIPFYKHVIASVLLLPMSITLAASLHYDGCIIATTIYLICLLLKIYLQKDYYISKKDAIIIVLLSVLIVSAKVVYSLIFLLVFFIPKEKFNLLFTGRKMKKLICIFVGAMAMMVSFLFWNIFIPNVHKDSSGKLSFTSKQYTDYITMDVWVFHEAENTYAEVIDSMNNKMRTNSRMVDNIYELDHSLEKLIPPKNKTPIKARFRIKFKKDTDLDYYLVISNEMGEREVILIRNDMMVPYGENFDRDFGIKWYITNIRYDEYKVRSNRMTGLAQSALSRYSFDQLYRRLIYDIYENRSFYLESTIGVFGLYEMFFPRIFIILNLFFIVFLSILDASKKITIYSKEKTVFILVYMVCVILINVIMLISIGIFTNGIIVGVHGRYYIPVLPLLLTFFYTRLPSSAKIGKVINPSLSQITMCFFAFSLTISCMLIVFRCYI